MIDQLTRTGASLVVDVTILFALAALAAAALRRSSAATRHFVWTLALTGAIALTLAVPFAPRLDVAVPWLAGPPPPAETAAPAASSSIPIAAPAPRTIPAGGPASPAAPSRSGSLMLLWLAGALVMAARYALGHLGLVRLRRRSTPITDPEWLARLDAARRLLGVTRDVALAASPDVGSPVTFGARRPIVLLPAESSSWGPSLATDVLLHELAHIDRQDVFVQFLSQGACALHWWNPMAWLAARGALAESERACDDRVLAAGSPPADYATHLLNVARGSRHLRLTTAVSIGMTRRSALEGRLLAVLDGASRRGVASRRLRIASGIALAAVLVPLVAVKFVPQARAAESRHAGSMTAVDEGTAIDQRVDAKEGETISFDLPTGGEVIVRGWDTPAVQVTGRLTGRDFKREHVTVERHGDRIVVQTRWEGDGNTSFGNRFEVHVPRRFDVHVESAGGSVIVNDLEGTIDGSTGGGTLKIVHVKGRAHLSTGGGDVFVDDCSLDGSVTTGGGKVRIEGNRGDLRGESGSGPVTRVLREKVTREIDSRVDAAIDERAEDDMDSDEGDDEEVPDVDDDSSEVTTTSGVLELSRAGGNVQLDAAPEGAVVSTGGGNVRIGVSSGRVEASTGGGDVSIGPVAGSVVASTGAGNVEVTLIDAGGEAQSVDIRTGRGRVTVTLPADFDGRLDLETARTENSSKSVRINAPSQWIQHREAPEALDDGEGTPRRYVRASGTAGRGKGLVKVRAVNGDIEIRLGT
ncbi:MAG: hypothetical protein HY049_13240 [Acidobacteria bacterium]|nr:hypothetical protein [Acidobacteriota bacterium]